jgi:rubrerythrin
MQFLPILAHRGMHVKIVEANIEIREVFMDDREIASRLKDLVQVDIDAVHAYGQAIENIDVPDVREQCIKFQSDHERHVTDLSAIIRRLGVEPPEFTRDFKGFLLEAFTAIRGITGTEGALKALRTGEEMTNKRYSEARSWEMPLDIVSEIQTNYEDEQRHLHYINQAIDSRIWETAAAKK